MKMILIVAIYLGSSVGFAQVGSLIPWVTGESKISVELLSKKLEEKVKSRSADVSYLTLSNIEKSNYSYLVNGINFLAENVAVMAAAPPSKSAHSAIYSVVLNVTTNTSRKYIFNCYLMLTDFLDKGAAPLSIVNCGEVTGKVTMQPISLSVEELNGLLLLSQPSL